MFTSSESPLLCVTTYVCEGMFIRVHVEARVNTKWLPLSHFTLHLHTTALTESGVYHFS